MDFKIGNCVILAIIISAVFGTEFMPQFDDSKAAVRTRANSALHRLLTPEWHTGRMFDLTHSQPQDANSTSMGSAKARHIDSDMINKLSGYKDSESMLDDLLYLNVLYAVKDTYQGGSVKQQLEDKPLESTSNRVRVGPGQKRTDNNNDGVSGNISLNDDAQRNSASMKDGHSEHGDNTDMNLAGVIGQVLSNVWFASPKIDETLVASRVSVVDAIPAKVSESSIGKATPLEHMNKNELSLLSQIVSMAVSKIQKSKESDKHTYIDEVVNDLRQLAKQTDGLSDVTDENREAMMISNENDHDNSHADINIERLLNRDHTALAYKEKLIADIINGQLYTSNRHHERDTKTRTINSPIEKTLSDKNMRMK